VPDLLFSAARLRTYRVLKDAGLGDPLEMQIVDRVVAGRLWVPFALIEIGFRNAADRAISRTHELGEHWFLDEGKGRDGDGLIAAVVEGPPAFRLPGEDEDPDDPIGEAARMAARQVGRERISRDDLIAHLMLGFWVARCPRALAQEPGLDMWDLLSGDFEAPLNDATTLRHTMSKLALMRNRIAHHEPLALRAKHVFAKDGRAKRGAALLQSLSSALASFFNEVDLAVSTATTIAPVATKYVQAVPGEVRAEFAPILAAIEVQEEQVREKRKARAQARAAEFVARNNRQL
jgi:hypothetical protein